MGFGLDEVTALEVFRAALEQVANIYELLENIRGGQVKKSVNCLRSVFYLNKSGDYYSFVSQYVMRKLVARTEGKIIRAMTEFSRSIANPSFDGWVFEFNFLNSVSSAMLPECHGNGV